MSEERYVDPSRANFDVFKALDRTTPLFMLNKLRFRDRAHYAHGHPLASTSMTGAEAYAHYGADSGPIFSRVGGSIIWRGSLSRLSSAQPMSTGTMSLLHGIQMLLHSWKW